MRIVRHRRRFHPRRSYRGQSAADSPRPISSASSAKRTLVRYPERVGALLRREGLYSSQLSKWRQQLDRPEAGTQSADKVHALRKELASGAQDACTYAS